jgi:hypothetical protein
MSIEFERIVNDLIIMKVILSENTYVRVPIGKSAESDSFLVRENRRGGFIYTTMNRTTEIHVVEDPKELTIYVVDIDSDLVVVEFSMPLTEEQRQQLLENLNPVSDIDEASERGSDFQIELDDDLPLGVELAPLHPIPVNPANIQDSTYQGDVFDSLMAESKPIAEYLAEDEDNVVFIVNNTSATGLPRQSLINAYEDRSAIRYQCNREGGLLQHVEDVDILNPYYKLDAPGTYLIPLDTMMSVMGSEHRIWVVNSIVPEKKMRGPIASRSVLTVNNETNVDGGPIDAVGANHCGPGQFEEMLVEPARLVPAGGRRRRTYRKKKGRKSTR